MPPYPDVGMPPDMVGGPGGSSKQLISKDPTMPPLNETGSALANVELWVQQQNASLQEGPFSPSFGPPIGKPPGGVRGGRGLSSPNRPPFGNEYMMGGPPEHHMYGGPPGPPMFMHHGGDAPMGQRGGRIPDENLTPEQLQRREEQLAQLQKIKQMLFPENRGGGGFDPRRPPGMYPDGPPGRGPGPEGMHHMMIGSGGPPPRFMPPDMMPPQHMMEPPPDAMMGPGGMGIGPPHPGMMFGGPEPGLPPNWENMSQE